MSRRAQQQAAQRAKILDAARELFSNEGFDEVTMAQVAESAGVARATVFNQFGSKHALVEALTDEVLAFYELMLDAAIADQTTPTPQLIRALFEQMAGGIELDRRFYRGVFREIAKLQLGLDEGGSGQRAAEATHARLLQLLTRGQERGEIHVGHDPETLVAALTSLVNGTITHWLYEDPSGELTPRMIAAAEVFLSPVATDRDPGPDAPQPELSPSPTHRTPIRRARIEEAR